MVGMRDPWHLLPRLQQEEVVDLVLSAYRSLVGDVAYVSMPITSGKRFYDVLQKNGVKDQAALFAKDKDALYDDIIKPNIDEGCKAAGRIAAITDLPLIAPAVFEAKKQRWSQHEYMYLWLSFIEEKVKEIYMLDGWQYSNGGMQELVRAMEMEFGWVSPRNSYSAMDDAKHLRTRQIRTYDERGKQITLDDAATLLSSAIIDLHIDGFETKTLRDGLQTLLDIGGVDYMETREEWEWHRSHEYSSLIIESASFTARDVAAGKKVTPADVVRRQQFLDRMEALAPAVSVKFSDYLRHQRISQQPDSRMYPAVPQMRCMAQGVIRSE